jgi:hypothetical protein
VDNEKTVNSKAINSNEQQNPGQGVDTSSLFHQPSDFSERNQRLVQEVGELLRDSGRFGSFKRVSNDFRQGEVRGDEYYKRCLELFGKNQFHKIFPELITLLPDIRKQNELLAAHERHVKYSKGAIPKKGGGGQGGVWVIQGQGNQDLLVCPNCSQVLAKKDGADHMTAH